MLCAPENSLSCAAMATVIDGKQTAAAVHDAGRPRGGRVRRRDRAHARPGHDPGGRGSGLTGVCPQQGRALPRAGHGLVPRPAAGDLQPGRGRERRRPLERRRAGRRDPRAAAAARRPRLEAGAGADRSVQGCRRVPPDQRGPARGQPAGAASVHAGRRDGAAARLRYPRQRRRRRGGGPLRHRRQAGGAAAPAPERDGHHRPLAHPRPGRGDATGRHPGGGGRPAAR